MAIQIYYFGSLVDITGKNVEEIDSMSDTDAVNRFLQIKYPALANTKYFMALNKKMIQDSVGLQQGDELALMPPFSGG